MNKQIEKNKDIKDLKLTYQKTLLSLATFKDVEDESAGHGPEPSSKTEKEKKANFNFINNLKLALGSADDEGDDDQDAKSSASSRTSEPDLTAKKQISQQKSS